MKLGRREKRVIALGCLVVAAFLFFQFGLSPALQRQKTLERLVTQKEHEVQEVQGLRETYLARKAVMEEVHRSLNRRGQEFAIFQFLEDLANKSGIKIMYMQPALSTAGELFRESSVEMKLDGIALQALIQYLYEIEQAPQLLRVRRLAIKPRAANPDMLDVTVQVSTFYLVEKSG